MAISIAFLTLLLAAPPADEAPGYIGIQPAPLTAELCKVHKVADDVKEGLLLMVVHKDSPAAKAGLRVGDVLTSFDNKPVKSIDGLIEALKARKAGDKVAYSARRGSGTIAGVLMLGKRPAIETQEVEEIEEIIEEPMPAAPKAQRERNAELEARARAVEMELDALRRAALEKRARAEAAARKGEAKAKAERAPRGFEDWIHREELGLKAAEQEENVQKMIWHKARLSLLREMREQGVPSAKQVAKKQSARVEQLEKRLADVLERLERLEKRMK